jgi:DNA repair photolyase
MPLNKVKGNMYPFVTHTWNPVKGECPYGCSYCYMKRWGKQSPLHLDKKELKTDLGENNFIFVGSSCDMWARDVPLEWKLKTMEHIREFETNRYLFQTKNTGQILNYPILFLNRQDILCTTIETDEYIPAIMGRSEPPFLRGLHLAYLQHRLGFKTMVTIEPVIRFNTDEMISLIKVIRPEQVNIGADTGRNNLPEPPKEQILELISELEKFTKVVQKKNLRRLMS